MDCNIYHCRLKEETKFVFTVHFAFIFRIYSYEVCLSKITYCKKKYWECTNS